MQIHKLFSVIVLTGTLAGFSSPSVHAQSRDYTNDSIRLLLKDQGLQMDIASAINNMYNYNMEEARQEFIWLRSYSPAHPLYPFLMGLSYWWMIVPNVADETYDDVFLDYMDLTIDRAEDLQDIDEDNPEANFFLAAAWGFKGRLYAERKRWGRATNAGRNAINYLEEGRKYLDYGPEFLFGDGLYNYYSIWIADNYPALRPVVNMFPEGDKEEGLKQLLEVSRFAFYTRTEAQYFLLSILGTEEGKPREALQIAEYLHSTYPNNPYFHRYYARLLYRLGRYKQGEEVCLEILNKIDAGALGYEATSGRYAAFFLGQIYEAYRDLDNAKKYYRRAVAFGEEIEATESGYFLYSLLNLAEIAEKEGDKKEAEEIYKQVKRYAKRSHPAHERARELLRKRRRGN